MAKARRVFEIAKELGVASKAVVTKCQAEGVPGITNHMSTVKIGLEQTIRQWFSEDDQAGEVKEVVQTAVETAEKVDLTRARRARRRQPAKPVEVEVKAPVEGAQTRVDQPAAVVAGAEAPSVAGEAVEVPPQVLGEADTEPVTGVDSAGPGEETVLADESGTPQAAGGEGAVVQVSEGPVGKPNVPDRPEVIEPIGVPLEKPQEAVLRGPRVVRIERADPVQAPRPRRAPAGTNAPAAGQGTGQDVGDAGRLRGVTRGRGPGGGGVTTPGAGGGRSVGKRRSLSTRRGRFADSMPAGPGKFSAQDLLELDARLNRSSGFLKQRRHQLKKSATGTVSAVSPVETGGRVEIAEPVTIKSLSAVTGIKSAEIVKYLFKKGVMATINSAIAAEAAVEVAMEYNIELVVKEQQTAEQLVLEQFAKRTEVDVRPRPPVVAVLGHVDHGKTSLLDKIRAADVASHEAGGITQHVGAYRVTVRGSDGQDKTVVFLDTPGHEAFTSMRARGASITDLVLLVVAADDGVMPQTIESINHAKAAGVPIVVALNKIDKAEATEENIRKIYGQMAEHGLNPVEWGGTAEVVKASAINGQGVTDLLEVLDYQAELLELKADYGGAARGTVIESQMQPGRGPVARVLVQEGQLKVGGFVVIGRAFGRVRDMTDDHGRSIREAGPATPLELSGIDTIPDAGDKFYITETLQEAEQVASQFRVAERDRLLAHRTKMRMESLALSMGSGGAKELRVVLKADVQGSIDVLQKTLGELGSNEVAIKVLHAGVGGVTESDVLLADASEAVVIGFHVVASPYARELAEQHGVDIRSYRVIYDVTNDLTRALEGMLEPETKEEHLGDCEVRQVFKVSKVGLVAGSMVVSGVVNRSAKVRVSRDGVVVTEGRSIESLRRVKEDVREVKAGTECGIRVAGFDDLKPGDHLACYKTISVARKLD